MHGISYNRSPGDTISVRYFAKHMTSICKIPTLHIHVYKRISHKIIKLKSTSDCVFLDLLGLPELVDAFCQTHCVHPLRCHINMNETPGFMVANGFCTDAQEKISSLN
jgi:hypothetical protein